MLESVSERKAGRLAELGVETVLDLITTYPRRYIDRTRQADVSGLQVGDEAAVLADGAVGARARRARTGPGRRRRRGARRHRPAQDRLLQPALAGQAARGRHRGDLLRQGDRVPGRPPDDEPRRRRGGRRDAGPQDAADPARVPGLGQGRADVVGDRGVRRRRRSSVPASSPTRCPSSGGTPSTCGTAPTPSGPSTAPSRSTWSSRRAAGWSSTSSSGCSWPWCCAGGPSRTTPARCTTPCRRAR